MRKVLILAIILIFLASCTIPEPIKQEPDSILMEEKALQEQIKEKMPEERPAPEELEKATLAGGCFWCMESPYEKKEGVFEVISGYAGGKEENPTYKQVSADLTGHVEAVQITFDPKKISYKEILDIFWRQIDPTDDGGQFVDRGHSYTTAIFYHSEEQRKIAEQSLDELNKSGKYDKPIITPIKKFTTFYRAEDYHQDYYKKSPIRYKIYRKGSGRDEFISAHWREHHFEKPSDAELREMLTPLQYEVTQKDGTERAYDNTYWDHKDEGIYVDIVSGEPLFSSTDKYDSKTGWPSFTKPLEPDNVKTKLDLKIGIPRTELRSVQADSHIGHLFKDGPKPAGLRYCINSAALNFIPKKDLEKKGYGKYMKLFE